MNEHEWLTGTDPLRLLEVRYPMRGHDSTEPQSRQSRLCLLACARRHWARLPVVCRAAVWLGELHADAPRHHRRIHAGVTPATEHMMTACNTADDAHWAERELWMAEHIDAERDEAWASATATPVEPGLSPAEWHGVTVLVHLSFESRTPPYRWVSPEHYELDLLRDVFGNPFRRVPFRPEWRTDTVVTLAKQMYDAREFGAMGILADALQDAGCDSDAVLDHCRGDGPHARGCWVLDAVLKTPGERGS